MQGSITAQTGGRQSGVALVAVLPLHTHSQVTGKGHRFQVHLGLLLNHCPRNQTRSLNCTLASGHVLSTLELTGPASNSLTTSKIPALICTHFLRVAVCQKFAVSNVLPPLSLNRMSQQGSPCIYMKCREGFAGLERGMQGQLAISGQ